MSAKARLTSFILFLLWIFWGTGREVCFGTVSVTVPRIVVMNGFPDEEKGLSEYIGEFFRKKFGSSPDYKTDIYLRATQLDLFKELHSDQNDALLWFSHGIHRVSSFTGLTNTASISDSDGNNIAPLFLDFYPRIRLLGVIACYSGPTLAEIGPLANGSNGSESAKSLPMTQVIYFDEKITVDKSLEEAARSIEEKLGQPIPRDVPSFSVIQVGIPVRISRRRKTEFNTDFLPSARIEFGERVLGIFPDLSADQEQAQSMIVVLPADIVRSTAQHNLTIVAGRQRDERRMYARNPYYFGEFVVESLTESSIKWELFLKTNGTPYGVGKQLFLYRGSKPLVQLLGEHY